MRDTTDALIAREEQQIALLESAKDALARATSIEDVLEVRDQASALKAYAKMKKVGGEVVRLGNEMLLRAERRLGEFTGAMEKAPPKAGPGRGRKTLPGDGHRFSKSAALTAAGIRRQDASRFEAIAAIPEKQFEVEVVKPDATTQRLARIGGECRKVGAKPRPQPTPRLSQPHVSDRILERRAEMYRLRVARLTRKYVQGWPAEKSTALLVRALRREADELEGANLGESLA